jgi:hypothetical protein
MDTKYTGLNYQALQAIRTVEKLDKFERGMIPSCTTVQRTCTLLEDHMKNEWGIVAQSIPPFGTYDDAQLSFEMVGFDAEILLRFLLKHYGLYQLAQEQEDVEIAITCDGAEFTKNVGHVTIGWKIVDPRSKEPLNKEFNVFLNNIGYQSVDNCYPIRTAVEKESHDFFATEFGDVYALARRIAVEGLPQTDKEPALKKMKVSAPHDGKGVFEVLGRGGGAKACELFCPYCSCSSSSLCETTTEPSLQCALCRIANKPCPHWAVEDKVTIQQAKEKFEALAQYHYCVGSEFEKLMKEIKTPLIVEVVPNYLELKGQHIDFQYHACTDSNDSNFQQYFDAVASHVFVRKKYGHFATMNCPSEQERVSGGMMVLRDFLSSVVSELKTIMKNEASTLRWHSIIQRDIETRDNKLLDVECMVPDIMHLVNRANEKIVRMLLIKGAEKAHRSKTKFYSDCEKIINSTAFWGGGSSGRSRCRQKWTFPRPDSANKTVGKVSFSYKKSKLFMASIDKLYDFCLGNNPKRAKFIEAVNLFIRLTAVLEKKTRFTDDEIITLQLEIDRFGELWIEVTGLEGMCNYIHYLVAGHITYYLKVYRNLYAYSQQGWEQLNCKMKQFYFRRTQRGGNKSGGNFFFHIYRFLARRMAWRVGIGDEFFKNTNKRENTNTDDS